MQYKIRWHHIFVYNRVYNQTSEVLATVPKKIDRTAKECKKAKNRKENETVVSLVVVLVVGVSDVGLGNNFLVILVIEER